MSPDDFARVTRSLPEPHLLVDSGGVILAANRAAADLFRAPRAELCGRVLAELLEADADAVEETLASAAASGQMVPLRIGPRAGARSIRVDGGVVEPAAAGRHAIVLLRFHASDEGNPFLLLTRKIEELSGEIRRRMALERERSELLRATEAAREEAERASRLKDEFLATVSHELRTPLNAILGWATMLRDGEVAAGRTDLALRTIERSARTLTQLVDDLLDVSRMMAGSLRLEARAVNVSQVVDAALAIVRPAAAVKDIRLDAFLEPDAGPVTGDPHRLQQVAWNLLTNAIKFTPKGGRVQVRVARVSSGIEIVVADNGPGIEPEFLPHVFDRFRQADASHSRPHGGVGLGLSIARHLVEAHAGEIRAESNGPGTGATFTVTLPAAQ